MKQMRKLLSVLLAVLMVFSLMSTALATGSDEPALNGKVVILHSNDVHGALEGYAKIAALRDEYAAAGAQVILADAGDYSQGTPYVSLYKGASAIEMMNAVGYDVVTLGNHEFDYGDDNLMSNLKDAKFQTICGDVFKDGKSILKGWTILEKAGVKIGFVGLETPETYTKVNPGLIQGVSFPQKEELYQCAQTLVNEVRAAGADLVVGLIHLGVDDESIGNRSIDLYEHVEGLDFLVDGHSHTAMVPGAEETWAEEKENSKTHEMEDVFHTNPCKDLPIQSTGTKFNNVGVIVIDPATKQIEDTFLRRAKDIAVPADSEILARAKEIEKTVDDQYGAVFARSMVELNGDKAPGNRNQETNLGDLITDAMVWSVLKHTELDVPSENVVGITNGGGIRAWIHQGDITMKDINTVLPFGNTVAVIYVTGAELLEALEASCYSTPGAMGGFPQVSGLQFTLNIEKEFDQGEQYPASTYYAPNSIQRVTIDRVNGFLFDPDATYAVVTNNFCAAGGDTYYAFKAASDQFDTSIPMDEALMDYITEVLGGVIGENYAEPQGRIFIGTTDQIEQRDLDNEAEMIEWFVRQYEDACSTETFRAFEDAVAAYEAAENNADRAKALDAMKAAARSLEFKPNGFEDVKDEWFAPAVDFAAAAGFMNGVGENRFAPYSSMTRAMVVTVLYRMAGEPGVEGMINPFSDVSNADDNWYRDAVIWAADAGITKGKSSTEFVPDATISREQMATMLVRFYGIDSEPELDEEDAAWLDAFLAESFTDSDSISAWAKYAVAVCKEAGFINGDPGGTFRPTDGLSRAECAQILLNAYYSDLDIFVPTEEPGVPDAVVEALFSLAA